MRCIRHPEKAQRRVGRHTWRHFAHTTEVAAGTTKAGNDKRRLQADGSVVMIHYSDYLREQAAKYRVLAEAATVPAAKREFLELAAV